MQCELEERIYNLVVAGQEREGQLKGEQPFDFSKTQQARSTVMRNIIYIVGLIVVVLFILSLLGLR